MNTNIQNNTNIDIINDVKKINLINNLVDVISHAFYPCVVNIPKIENNNLLDKIINYFILPRKYECEFFRFEILENNKIIYEILNEYEPESNLYSFFSGCKYYEFDIINNEIFTDGKINHRHLLMLNDFADFNLEFDYITLDEFEKFKEKIRQDIDIFSYDELINMVQDIFIKTKTYKYDCFIKIIQAPLYDINLRDIKDYKKLIRYPISIDEEISEIKNRIWLSSNGYFSPSTTIFSLRALQYTCLMNSKLYCVDINNLSKWNTTYSLIPYTLLFKAEGGINFNHCNYTYWNKLISEIKHINYKPYFELINSSHIKSNHKTDYYTTYIPVHELIVFCKILEKEGTKCSYKFNKN